MIQPLTTPEPGYTLIPKEGEIETQTLEVSMGPHHPSTHGVFRMDAVLDGEEVRRLKPVLGYLHRNHEQLAEKMNWLGSIPFTDRLDYFCSMTNNWAYCLAVEQLAGIKVPERAEYIRVIMAELTRLQNHSCQAGFLLSDTGAWGTPLLYAFREREKILDLFEAASGARMMCNYMRFGGVRADVDDDWLAAARKVVENYPRFIDELEALITDNEILLARTQRIGILPRELARLLPQTRWLLYTAFPSAWVVRIALEAGAHGCVSKGASHLELVKACQELLAGGSYFCPESAKALRTVMANRARDAELNSTEQKILLHVAGGMEPKDIAICVGVEVGTVRNYMVQIRQKLRLTSMVDIAKYAVEHGLAPPE